MSTDNNEAENISRYSLMLYESLAEEKGIKYIVETAAKILNNPILVANNSRMIIAHSEMPKTNNKFWNELVMRGFYSDDKFPFNTNNPELYQSIYGDSQVRILTDKGSPDRYISKRIVVDGKIFGFATCVELETPLTDKDLEIFSVFCKVAGLGLKNYDLSVQGCDDRYGYFMLDMITGSLNLEYIDERISGLKLKYKKNNSILVLEFAEPGMGFEHEMSYYRRIINEIIPKGNCMVYHKSLVIMLSMDESDVSASLPAKTLDDFLTTSNMLGGLSHCFHNIRDMRKAYLQACAAISVGRKMSGAAEIYDYKKVMSYHMLDLLYDKVGGDLRQFCSPKLLDIIDYDAKYNTQFAYTVFLFIRCDKNPTKTSKSLKIHRNTVDYRINKVLELFDIDLRSQEMTFSLDISFRILEYLHELPG